MTGRVHDMILDPKLTGQLPEVIAEGGYYGMQTFDQHLLKHLQAGPHHDGGGDAHRHLAARLQADGRRRGEAPTADGRAVAPAPRPRRPRPGAGSGRAAGPAPPAPRCRRSQLAAAPPAPSAPPPGVTY